MNRLATVALLAALATTACATAPDGPPAPPNYAPLPSQPAPANARLYVDCFRQAIAADRYRRTDDGDGTELLLFTCTDAPARAFYDALGPWSAQIGSEFTHAGRTVRSTARVQSNLFGVDHCSIDAAGGDPTCILSFNAGDFLDQ